MPESTNWFVPNQNPAGISLLFHMCHMHHPSHSPSFDQPQHIWWKIHIMKFIIIPFSPVSCCYPLGTNILPIAGTSPCSGTPSASVFPLIWESEFHTPKKRQYYSPAFMCTVRKHKIIALHSWVLCVNTKLQPCIHVYCAYTQNYSPAFMCTVHKHKIIAPHSCVLCIKKNYSRTFMCIVRKHKILELKNTSEIQSTGAKRKTMLMPCHISMTVPQLAETALHYLQV